MVEQAARIAEKVENQLSQVILYLGAIDSLAEAYRECEALRHDAFLFHTVCGGLWDALIVRMGAIWDGTKNVASLPKLSAALRRLASLDALAAAKAIDEAKSSERSKLKEWRDTVVAHSRLALDQNEFDSKYSINIAEVRREAERVEQLLAAANRSLGRLQVYYEVLKEDAMGNARKSLARWRRDAA